MIGACMQMQSFSGGSDSCADDAAMRVPDGGDTLRHTRSMRRYLRPLLLVAVLVAAFGPTPQIATASCISPNVTTEVRHIRPSETLRIQGQYWAAECNDTVSCSGGCGGGCVGGEPSPPIRDITLSLRPSDTTAGAAIILAQGVQADENFAFMLDVVIPEDTVPGRYRIVARSGSFTAAPAPVIRVAAA